MKVILAFDSFKGTMTAREVCDIVRKAMIESIPDSIIVLRPMADGGEGTAEVLLASLNGKWIPARVMGPLPHMELDVGYGWIENDQRAIVEMASASGITHLSHDQLNPLKTTTYGTGSLIKSAIANGARNIWLTVGGSATIDGGIGAAMALGWRFLDRNGKSIGFGGAELGRIARIVAPPDTSSIPAMNVLCDVTNPLCGKNGAAAVFGPQKGATPEMVEHLESGLHHLAKVVGEQLGKKIMDLPHGGAAGGLAAGATAFCNARLISGIEAVMDATDFISAIQGADWVITGEGRFDAQSLQGKVVSGVASAARNAGVRAAVLAGHVDAPAEKYRAMGIDLAWATARPDQTKAENIRNARALLRERALELAQYINKR